MHRNAHALAATRWALLLIVVTAFVLVSPVAYAGVVVIPPTALLVVLVAAVFVPLCAWIAPSHKRIVGVFAVLGPVVFVVNYAPVPNLGQPFGYWAYPNRAINAFLKCPNVTSATLGYWHHDIGLEEFGIVVTFSDLAGTTSTQQILFPRHPTRKQIREHVATIGCRT